MWEKKLKTFKFQNLVLILVCVEVSVGVNYTILKEVLLIVLILVCVEVSVGGVMYMFIN